MSPARWERWREAPWVCCQHKDHGSSSERDGDPRALGRGGLGSDLYCPRSSLHTVGPRAEAGRAARRLLLEPRLTPGLKVEPPVLLTDRMQDE